MKRALSRDSGRYDFTFAASAREGIEHVRRTPFDVVVSDLDMGEISGDVVLAEVEARSPHALRVLHTARDDVSTIEMRAHLVVFKPASLDALRRLFDRAAAAHAATWDPG